MVMLEGKAPEGCFIPDENYDWSGHVIDQCIVDTWVLAKIKPNK